MRRTDALFMSLLVIFLFSQVATVFASDDHTIDDSRVQTRLEKLEEQKAKIEKEKQERISEAQQKSVDSIKTSVLAYITRLEGHVSESIQKVTDNTDLTQDQKSVAMQLLNKSLEKLSEYKVQVASATTLDDLRLIKENLTTLWKNTMSHRHTLTYLLYVQRHQQFVDKAAALADRIEEKASSLGTSPEVMDALSTFRTELENAKSKLAQAELLLRTISLESSDTQATVQQAQSLIKEARSDIHDAVVALRSALQKLKDGVEHGE